MKNPKKAGWRLLAVAVLGATLLGATYSSIYNVVQRGGVYFNPTTNFKTNVTGDAMVDLANPVEDRYSLIQGAMSGFYADAPWTSHTPGTFMVMDSSQIIDTKGYSQCIVYYYYTAAGTSDPGGSNSDSLAGVQIALEMRGHNSAIADSTSTFVIPLRAGTGGGTALVNPAVDSLGMGTKFDMVLHGAQGTSNSTPSNILAPLGSAAAFTMPRDFAFSHELPIYLTNFGGTNRGQVLWSGAIGTTNGGVPLPRYLSFKIRALRSYTFFTGNIIEVADTNAVATWGVGRWRGRMDIELRGR